MGTKLKELKAKAIERYPNLGPDGKILLEDFFGKETFVHQRLGGIENINSWDDVLNYHGLTQAEFDKLTVNFDDDDIANKEIKLIAAAINDGPLDHAKTWYYPVFNRVAGFGFSLTYYDYWYTSTVVGERRSFATAAGAMHAGKTFPDKYKPYMLIINKETHE